MMPQPEPGSTNDAAKMIVIPEQSPPPGVNVIALYLVRRGPQMLDTVRTLSDGCPAHLALD
ncbi:MAG: hypothetical protein WBP29_12240 [Candidatus Zixiibacteriota bacterium]